MELNGKTAPVTRDGYKFREDISIPCYQTDRNMLLRPSGFMDLAQEIAYWAAECLGFGYDSLHIHHMAWVLARMHIHFEKPVRWRDSVSLFTWHKGGNGLFYLRDFELRDRIGEMLVGCTSSWVVMNDETRRIMRPEDIAHLLEVEDVDSAIEEPAPKLLFPKEGWESAAKHTVVYSDVDLVGHTNNARYAMWAMDCIPEEDACRPVKDIYINFNKETKFGEEIELLRCFHGSGWFVEGRSDGKSCFVLKTVY